MKIPSQFLWLVFGVAYGLALRVLFANAPHFLGGEIISTAFFLGTPFAIGAIIVYGLRNTKPTVGKMLIAPWLAIAMAMIGSALAMLEGSICIILASPILFSISSIGGLVMGLVLRWTNKGTATLNSILVLPLVLTLIAPARPPEQKLLAERVSINVAATPHRIWTEIRNARGIRQDELPFSFARLIGVPRPLEGINITTVEGEVRFSKWDRGVNFSALVVNRIEDRSITWRYRFAPDSFPAGSLDDHVKIGGQYFDLYDTTFNLVPMDEKSTRLEIISHYRVTTDINFYAVPVARYIAKDFMSSIVGLYKRRSEGS
jgi:hypothetical protein